MGNMFSYDNRFIGFLDRVSDLFILAVLTTVCCVPIVTIGASLTAMHTITLHMANNEDGRVLKPFFKAFKQNFAKSTVVWLVELAIMALLYGDYYVVYRSGIEFSVTANRFLTIGACAFGLVALFIGTYFFPLQARYENTIKATARNAFVISIMKIPQTLLLIIINILPIFIGFNFPLLWPPMLLIAFGISSFVSAKIYTSCFKAVTEQKEKYEAELVEARDEDDTEDSGDDNTDDLSE